MQPFQADKQVFHEDRLGGRIGRFSHAVRGRRVGGQLMRSHTPPLFGWLATRLDPYPDAIGLKTHVHLGDDGIRPYIEREATSHPLAVEQREGITTGRVAQIDALLMHGQTGPG
ncbi:hypothetical protein BMR85_014840 [Achromobacter sp. KAs 3-5]|nr:hypothetical protein BMR85_014840 [Achromobacter sp. KAs 3-5]